MDEIMKQAISQERLIDFYYQGLHRVAEPHILGVCNGITQALVYQIDGQNKSGRLPNWKRIDIHEVSHLQILDKTFPGRRSFPSGKHSSWDIHLAVVD